MNKEEHARRGLDIYERFIRPTIGPGKEGKVVAIDVESGAFEMGDDVLSASRRLLDAHPDAQTWFVRVGHRGLHRLGSHAS